MFIACVLLPFAVAIITLTTDFGWSDGYVGAMKGVIMRLVGKTPVAQYTRLVDIAHDIPRGDIAHAAWVVATSTREFPEHSIHLVVIDPGVGGNRQAGASLNRSGGLSILFENYQQRR